MSNHGLAMLVAACLSAHAWGQSPALLEAVRVHAPKVTELAEEELRTCVASSKPCADRARLSLLTGLLQLSDNRAADAVKTLQSVKPPKLLEGVHAWYLGEALAYAQQPIAAIKSISKAQKLGPAWLTKRAEIRVAELQLTSGQAAKALPVIEARAAADPTAELLLLRAEARHATKNDDGAIDDYRFLLVRFPAHPHAELAQRALGPIEFTFEERMTRTQALMAAGRASAALKEAEAAAKLAPDTKAAKSRVALVRGLALLMTQDDAKGLAELETAATGTPLVAAEALNAKARRLMRLGKNDEAREAFLALDTKYPNDVNADEAGYFYAWLAMQSGADDEAATAFERFETKHASSRKRDEARWFRGYCQLRAGHFAEARKTLQSVAEDFPKSSLLPQTMYWAARAAESLPKRDAGPAIDVGAEYAAVISGFSGSFYSLLSQQRLADLKLPAPEIFKEAPVVGNAKPPAKLSLAVELVRAGLFHDASDEVQRVVGSVGRDEAKLYAQAFQTIGDFGAAYMLAARYLWGAVYSTQEPEAVALLYPRAYQAEVSKQSEANALEPSLAWAIMRRESSFRSDVISSADARGLMQIIPPTATAIAKELKADAPNPDDLYAPSTNIRFGTWYLSALMKKFGHPALCAAAYNGGPSAVSKWLGARGSLPLDRFVEEIPFKETRNYVKQVMADYAIYQRLYAGEAKPLAMELPTPKANGVTF